MCPQKLCSKCSDLEPFFTPEEEVVHGGEGEGQEEAQGEIQGEEGDEDGASEDDEEEEEEGQEGEEEDEEDGFPPGSVVWCRLVCPNHLAIPCHSRTRSWYAGQVLGLMDLPEQVLRDLGKNPSGSVIVKRFGFDDLKVIRPDRLDSLGENRVDRARAAVSPEIGAGYDIALAVINGDM